MAARRAESNPNPKEKAMPTSPAIRRPTFDERDLALDILRSHNGSGILTMLEAIRRAQAILDAEKAAK